MKHRTIGFAFMMTFEFHCYAKGSEPLYDSPPPPRAAVEQAIIDVTKGSTNQKDFHTLMYTLVVRPKETPIDSKTELRIIKALTANPAFRSTIRIGQVQTMIAHRVSDFDNRVAAYADLVSIVNESPDSQIADVLADRMYNNSSHGVIPKDQADLFHAVSARAKDKVLLSKMRIKGDFIFDGFCQASVWNKLFGR
jgi:hypothetical protein